jgi:hypothetical protein
LTAVDPEVQKPHFELNGTKNNLRSKSAGIALLCATRVWSSGVAAVNAAAISVESFSSTY